jgi:hypothetical protein
MSSLHTAILKSSQTLYYGPVSENCLVSMNVTDANLFLFHLGCSLLGLVSLKHSHSLLHLEMQEEVSVIVGYCVTSVDGKQHYKERHI